MKAYDTILFDRKRNGIRQIIYTLSLDMDG